jgi:peptidoglycan hydrolase CwlO-like protein
MRKKRVLIIAVVLVLSMFLSGCGASAPVNGSVDALKADLKIKEDIINVLMSEKEALIKEVSELQTQVNLLQSNSVLKHCP